MVRIKDVMPGPLKRDLEKDVFAYELLKEMSQRAKTYLEMREILDKMRYQLDHAIQMDRVNLLDYPLGRLNQKILLPDEETPDSNGDN